MQQKCCICAIVCYISIVNAAAGCLPFVWLAAPKRMPRRETPWTARPRPPFEKSKRARRFIHHIWAASLLQEKHVMNPITQPLEFQAAAIRMAGYAMVNQMKIMQIVARSAFELPMAPVQALHVAAASPEKPVEKTTVKAKATAPRVQKSAVKKTAAVKKTVTKVTAGKPEPKPAEFSAKPRAAVTPKAEPAAIAKPAARPAPKPAPQPKTESKPAAAVAKNAKPAARNATATTSSSGESAPAKKPRTRPAASATKAPAARAKAAKPIEQTVSTPAKTAPLAPKAERQKPAPAAAQSKPAASAEQSKPQARKTRPPSKPPAMPGADTKTDT
ncbi:hypothetical protein GS634_05205 [Ruegeria atlantica]|uniref:Uncharacterized protein n=1 Tax=Ruegeria atlantica TaxID=81569 RepID=A0AA90YWQ7_9RHOB|nr:hypothetical protein [Ruegeria atlantica]NOE17520.1 hypothetical protein [Ruegeria atlantica]